MGQGGGIFGSPLGKSSGPEKESSKYAGKIYSMGRDYWDKTAPLRNAQIQRSMDFMNQGPFDPANITQDPVYGAGKSQIEDQFGVGQEQLLSTMPAGGGLQAGMQELASDRIDSLGGLAAQIAQGQYDRYQNEAAKAYGVGQMSPQIGMQGVTGAGGINAPVMGSQASKQGDAMAAIGNICCFIFIAGHGFLHPIVRRYRNLKMNRRNRRGYYWLSDRLVPWMKKSRAVKSLVDFSMIKPMTSYGKHYFGLNRVGVIFTPVTAFWLLIYSMLGHRPPYRRKGTMEVV